MRALDIRPQEQDREQLGAPCPRLGWRRAHGAVGSYGTRCEGLVHDGEQHMHCGNWRASRHLKGSVCGGPLEPVPHHAQS
jgi:hypothetical protein